MTEIALHKMHKAKENLMSQCKINVSGTKSMLVVFMQYYFIFAFIIIIIFFI